MTFIRERTMRTFNRFAAMLGLAVFSAQAQAVEFSFLSGAVTPEAWGNTNTYSATVDGLALTASAWSSTGKRDLLKTAELVILPGYGMGACNRDEGINCTDKGDSHALDNKGASDLILFSFSRAVSLGTLTLLQVGGDSDLSLWAGMGAIGPSGMPPSALGTATLIDHASSANAINIVALDSAFTGSYDWLAVAARLGHNNDFASLLALKVEPVSQPVPEAETWAMLLTGVGLIGFVVRRRS
jgi:hypothetical protein